MVIISSLGRFRQNLAINKNIYEVQTFNQPWLHTENQTKLRVLISEHAQYEGILYITRFVPSMYWYQVGVLIFLPCTVPNPDMRLAGTMSRVGHTRSSSWFSDTKCNSEGSSLVPTQHCLQH
jgi:hypothetical protein